ncbi:hypothetical protein [Niallia sp.]|nr:hypothetical protein [Niallia sp.]
MSVKTQQMVRMPRKIEHINKTSKNFEVREWEYNEEIGTIFDAIF